MWYTKIHLAMKLQREDELPQDLINTTSHIIKTISQVILLSHTHLMIMLLKINNINLKRLASNRSVFFGGNEMKINWSNRLKTVQLFQV